MKAFTNESERAAFEAQMLYGSHVFARAKVIPDLAIAKGDEAHRYAKEIGDPNLEFLAAGGTAMALLDLGDVDDAQGVDRSRRGRSRPSIRARSARAGWRPGGVSRTRPRATPWGCVRTWSAPCSRRPESGQIAARCEALARLAVESARLGACDWTTRT